MSKKQMKKSNLFVPENEFLKGIQNKKEEEQLTQMAEDYKAANLAKQKEIEEKLETLEILPTRDKVIIMPYPSNPYTNFATESGILLGQYDGSFFNTDSGEMDRMDQMVQCGKVIHVGPETKYVQVGDDVYFDSRTVFPFPFMNTDYKLTSEVSLLAIINDGLSQRIKEIKDGNKY